jgi:hypothetical protein
VRHHQARRVGVGALLGAVSDWLGRCSTAPGEFEQFCWWSSAGLVEQIADPEVPVGATAGPSRMPTNCQTVFGGPSALADAVAVIPVPTPARQPLDTCSDQEL